jgi:uncharacterized protein (TIGR00297 family)
MTLEFLIVAAVIIIGMVWSATKHKLTLPASIVGGSIAMIIYAAAGYIGVVYMTSFFLLGTIATSWKLKYKQSLGLADLDKTSRTAGQVLANAGVAAILAVVMLVQQQYSHLFLLMIAGSFSAATADTLSSELGNVYGTKFYNVRTFKKDQRGLDGVISFEGTLIGCAGSMLIAAIHLFANGWSIELAWIIIAGTLGNLADSLLGATLERSKILNNDAVNFINTAVGAVATYLLYILTS